MATNTTLLSVMGMLEGAFGAKEQPTHRVYMARFKDTPDADLMAAASRCIDELRTFPTIRDLLDRLPGRLTLEQAAEAAWTRVVCAAFNGPTTYNPHVGTRPTGASLDQPALDAIGGINGLYRLWECEGDPEQTGFMRRDFMERFKAQTRIEAAGLIGSGESAGLLPNPLFDGPVLKRAPELLTAANKDARIAAACEAVAQRG